MKNSVITAALLVALYLGCSQGQKHDVLEPEWPRYKFGGEALDTLTGNLLDSCQITITAAILVYDDDFTSATTTSDSNGSFLFSAIPVGNHLVTAEKDSYCASKRRIAIWYKDKIDYQIFLYKLSDAPDIAVSPTIFQVTLNMGNSTDRTLTISNTGGPISLNWEIDDFAGWLTESPTFGSLGEQENQDVTLHFDASGLFDGVYNTMLNINSNDPVNPVVEVYVQLTVQ